MRMRPGPADQKSELRSIVLFVIALLVLLSLISYAGGRYLVGKFGKYIAYFLYFAFGWGAYLVPLSLGSWAWKSFRSCTIKRNWIKVSSLFMLLFAVCSFLSITINKVRVGGWVGYFISHSLLLPVFGTTGTYLIVITAMIVSLKLLLEVSIVAILNKMPLPRRTLSSRKVTENVPRKAEQEKTVSLKETSQDRGIRMPGISSPLGRISYMLPPLDLLRDPPKANLNERQEELRNNADLLEKTLMNFGISAKVTEIHPGPVITRYDIQIAPGIKVSSVVNLSDDLALTLRAQSIRILAPVPGKPAIGIEIPNQCMALVYLKELIQSPEFRKGSSLLSFALGKTVNGKPYIADLARLPHLLIAGATGSGKTVCIHSIILSLLFRAAPHDLHFLLIDPKMVELPIYNGIPHLKAPVITEVRASVAGLRWIVSEMENRYRLLANSGLRDISEYNETYKHQDKTIPYIVVIIDELADLMATSSQQVEQVIIRLAQMSRAVGIHLILATQRPSVNVITGIIKANLPARVAFEVTSKVDSRIILDMNGAENLLGRGDMLYLPPGEPKPVRLQGAFVSREEIKRVVDFIKAQKINYTAEPVALMEVSPDEHLENKELLKQALKLTLERKQASTSLFKGALHISDGKAANLISIMETKGLIGPQQGSKPRQIFLDKIEEFWHKMERDETS